MERNNNRVLQGNFAPITDEPTITGLEVKGTLPPELDGIYMRNGPNQRLRPYDGLDGMHWFDGDGMVHYVRFCGPGCKPEYGARYMRTRGFKEEEAVGHTLYCSIQDNPILECCKQGLGSKLRHFFSPDSPWWVLQNKNTANNALVYHAGKLMALYEVAMPYPLSIREAMDGTLDFNTAEEANTFDGALNGWLDNFTAHPKIDPETGEMMFIGYNLVGKSLKVAVVSAEGKIVNQHWMTYAIPERSTLMHDMAITATRTILLDQPLLFDMMKSVRELGRPFTFDASQPSFFGVMPRHGGRDDMVWIPFNAGYCFHVINAYDHPDNPDRVVVVALRMAATNAVGMADLEGCREEDLHQAGHLHLWELDIPTRQTVQDRQLDSQSLEYPCINPLFEGRPFRYSFLCQVEDGTANPGPPLFNGIVRYDLETGESRRYLLPEDHACGDLTFVPRNANTSDECDGFVLSFVHNLRDGTTALVVLDAARVEEGPVAEVLIPRRVPFGFHCTYTGPEVVHQS